MQRISTARKLGMRKGDVISIIMLDKGLSGSDLKFLEDEFDFYKEDIDKFVSQYKNLGIVFKLNAIEEDCAKDWKGFLILRSGEVDRFSNMFAGSNCDKVLLITNKRLLNIDLDNINEKIEEMNFRIEKQNESALSDIRDMAPASRKGIFGRLIDVLRK